MSVARDIYSYELEQIVRKQQAFIDSMLSLLNPPWVQYERQAIADRLAQLNEWKDDPSVLVRTTPGSPVKVFHNSVKPCGRARDKASYEEMLLGEALARNLEPCTACAMFVETESAGVVGGHTVEVPTSRLRLKLSRHAD